jgi:hypothetical protein
MLSASLAFGQALEHRLRYPSSGRWVLPGDQAAVLNHEGRPRVFRLLVLATPCPVRSR